MAGHSKWSQIKRKKAVTDQKRGAEYARFSKEISVAAKLGGPDPSFNFRLRNAIERAKAVSVPQDIIKRAINKYEDSKTQIEEILYEGYGPGGIAVLVEASTDNRNRTVAEIRHIFGKCDGNLGEAGCVSWGFRHLGIIYLPMILEERANQEDSIMELVIDTLEDMDLGSDPENILIYVSKDNLETTLQTLLQEYPSCTAELAYLPENTIEIENEKQEAKLDKLIEMLEELDDVQKVSHNAIN